jgi:hypothetical protein
MSKYEITFLWPTGDWTWTYEMCKDFHEAMLKALMVCPIECRVLRVEKLPS